MLGTRLFVCVVIVIFALGCGGKSSLFDHGITPQPDEVVLIIINENINDARVQITGRNCANIKGTFHLRGNETRSVHLKPTHFGSSARFRFLVHLTNPVGFDVVTRGCSGDSRPPPSGSIVKFTVPWDLAHLPEAVPFIIEKH